jgi:RHH-type proline utilization regulon transcriptional repressor/proline dehydrogenase/delta 1-pyrroline-5-carboxylate dehydrogenase
MAPIPRSSTASPILTVPVDDLIADPVAEAVLAMPVPGAPHPAIALPGALFGERLNSAGLDLSNEAPLALTAFSGRGAYAGIDPRRVAGRRLPSPGAPRC